LELLPTGTASATSELELLNEIGRSLIAVAGYSSAEVEQNYRRAADVARRLADAEQSFHALSGLRRFHQVQGDVRRARAISEELVSLAGRIAAPIFQAIAHHALGEALFLGGQPLEARSELETARNLLDELVASGTPATAEPRVTVRSYLGLTYWVLGYPNRAIEVAGEAAALAVDTGLPFARAYALTVMAWLHELRQEPDAALKYATEAHLLSIEHDYPYWATAAAVYGGWARASLGDPDAREYRVSTVRCARHSSTTARSACASSTLPTPVVCSGRGRPALLWTATDDLPWIRSTTRAVVPWSTARWTFSWVAA
jgi:ATP/maltotriose-dependent transcriptional regulator MalT